MKIIYDFKKEDVLAFTLYMSENNKGLKFRNRIALFIPLFIITIIFLNPIIDPESDMNVKIFMLAIWFLLILFVFLLQKFLNPVLNKLLNKQYLNKSDLSGLIGEHSLESNNEALIVNNPQSETKYKWESIKKVVDDKNHFYIFINDISAIVVPKNSIKDQTILIEFRKKLIEHIEEVR